MHGWVIAYSKWARETYRREYRRENRSKGEYRAEGVAREYPPRESNECRKEGDRVQVTQAVAHSTGKSRLQKTTPATPTLERIQPMCGCVIYAKQCAVCVAEHAEHQGYRCEP